MSVVVVNVSAGSTTTTLPLISSVPGAMITIKDSGSASASNTITVVPTAGNTFEIGTYVINSPLGFITFLGIGTRWRVIASTYPNVPLYTSTVVTPGVLPPANATINILTAGEATLGNTTVASLAAGPTTLNTLSTIGQAAFFSSVQVQGGLSVFSSITARNINFTGILTSNGTTFSGAPAGINSAGSIGINSASNASYSLLVTGNQSNTGTLQVAGATTLVNSSNTGTLGVAGTTTLTNSSNTGTLGVAGTTTLSNTSNTGTLGVAGYTTLASNVTIGSGLGGVGTTNTLIRLNQFVANTNWGYLCSTDGLGDVSLGANCYTSNGSWYRVNYAGGFSFVSARQGSIKFWCGAPGAISEPGNTDTSLTAIMSLTASGLTVTNTSNTGTLGVAGAVTFGGTLNTGGNLTIATTSSSRTDVYINTSSGQWANVYATVNDGIWTARSWDLVYYPQSGGVFPVWDINPQSNLFYTNLNFQTPSNITAGGTLNVTGLTTLVNSSNTGTLGVAGATTLAGTLNVTGLTTLVNSSNTGTLGVAGTTTLSNTSNTGTLGVAGYTTLASNVTIGSGLGSTAQANTLVRLNQFVANGNWGYLCSTDGLGDVSLGANCYTSNGSWYRVNYAGGFSFVSARQGSIKFWCGAPGAISEPGNTDTSLTAIMTLNTGGMTVTNTSNTGTLGVAGLTTLSSNLVLPLGTVGRGVVSAQSFTTEANLVNLINNAPTNGMGQTTGFPGLASWTASNQQPLQISGYNGINFVGGRGNWEAGASHMCVVDGQVGIRTRNPQQTLDVSGNIRASGTLGVTGASINSNGNNTSCRILLANGDAGSCITTGNPDLLSLCHNATNQGTSNSFTPINPAGFGSALQLNQGWIRNIILNNNGSGGYNLGTYTYLNNNGLGINTTTPQCPLDVNGNVTLSYAGGYYFDGAGGTRSTPASSAGISIRATHFILSSNGFIAVSDERIKKNIVPVTDSLDIVNSLNVVSFDYIDFHKNPVKHGLIAQQVKNVYPDAVTKTKDFIPSVFNVATTYEKTDDKVSITSSVPTGFSVNDKIKIYISDDTTYENEEKHETEVLEIISDTQFVVKEWNNFVLEKIIFIYGKEVDDFLAIDKPLIGLIAAGACKILSGQVTAQSSTITGLQTNAEAQASTISTLQTNAEAQSSTISTLQTNAETQSSTITGLQATVDSQASTIVAILEKYPV